MGAMTSANAAMPVRRANGDSSVVLIDCAYGWYRGPDGQCYPYGYGRQPGYYGGGYYGHRRWYGDNRDYYYRQPYRRYPYYGGPYGYGEDDE
jgi:hypothetical protein